MGSLSISANFLDLATLADIIGEHGLNFVTFDDNLERRENPVPEEQVEEEPEPDPQPMIDRKTALKHLDELKVFFENEAGLDPQLIFRAQSQMLCQKKCLKQCQITHFFNWWKKWIIKQCDLNLRIFEFTVV